jgi:antitoxin MazE
MRTHIIKIGNSQGIRIPKLILEQTGIVDDVELEVDKSRIIVRPVDSPRHGWDDDFKSMAEASDDMLIMGEANITHSWDEEEWEW